MSGVDSECRLEIFAGAKIVKSLFLKYKGVLHELSDLQFWNDLNFQIEFVDTREYTSSCIIFFQL